MNINEIIYNEDANGVEQWLIITFKNNDGNKYVNELISLLNYNWHFKHEDIVTLLQTIKPIDKKVCDSLALTATRTFQYLDYDENFGLARKCTWALADIGDEYAKDILVKLSKLENGIIAGYAEQRIMNWDLEIKRKAAQQGVAPEPVMHQ